MFTPACGGLKTAVIIDVYVNVNQPMPPAATDNEVLRQRVQTSLDRQGMMAQLGVRLLTVAPGTVTLALPYADRVTQQQGGFHGGARGHGRLGLRRDAADAGARAQNLLNPFDRTPGDKT